MQWCAIFPGKRISFPQFFGCFKDIGVDDIFFQYVELIIGQVDAVECFKLLPKVALQRVFVSNIVAVGVLEVK